jgi:hypothetical protein
MNKLSRMKRELSLIMNEHLLDTAIGGSIRPW